MLRSRARIFSAAKWNWKLILPGNSGSVPTSQTYAIPSVWQDGVLKIHNMFPELMHNQLYCVRIEIPCGLCLELSGQSLPPGHDTLVDLETWAKGYMYPRA